MVRKVARFGKKAVLKVMTLALPKAIESKAAPGETSCMYWERCSNPSTLIILSHRSGFTWSKSEIATFKESGCSSKPTKTYSAELPGETAEKSASGRCASFEKSYRSLIMCDAPRIA